MVGLIRWIVRGNKNEVQKTQKPQVDFAESIGKSKAAMALLEKRHTYLESKIKAYHEYAQKHSSDTTTNQAILALKFKKLFEKEYQQIGNAQLALQQQIMSLESAKTQHTAVEALASAVSAQKLLNEQLNLNKVDKLLAEIKEQENTQLELSCILSDSLPPIDEAELQSELNEMQETAMSKLLDEAAEVPKDIPGVEFEKKNFSKKIPATIISKNTQSEANAGQKAFPEESNEESDEKELQKLIDELL